MTELDTGWTAGFVESLRVRPGSKVSLPKGFDPGERCGVRNKRDGERLLQQGAELLAEYQDRLAAQQTYAVLVVLQGIDAAGKDSTISHVMSGVNPQGVHTDSFKAPSAEELAHDYLWRHARRLPARSPPRSLSTRTATGNHSGNSSSRPSLPTPAALAGRAGPPRSKRWPRRCRNHHPRRDGHGRAVNRSRALAV